MSIAGYFIALVVGVLAGIFLAPAARKVEQSASDEVQEIKNHVTAEVTKLRNEIAEKIR